MKKSCPRLILYNKTWHEIWISIAGIFDPGVFYLLFGLCSVYRSTVNMPLVVSITTDMVNQFLTLFSFNLIWFFLNFFSSLILKDLLLFDHKRLCHRLLIVPFHRVIQENGIIKKLRNTIPRDPSNMGYHLWVSHKVSHVFRLEFTSKQYWL